MSEHDSDDDDILGDLLANDDQLKPEESSNKIIEEFDFLQDTNSEVSKPSDTKNSKNLLQNLGDDSSDDDDNKYFEEQKYSEPGRNIKNLLKKQNPDSSSNSFKKTQLPLKSTFSNFESICEKKPQDLSHEKQNFLDKKKNTEASSSKDKKKSGVLTDWLNKPSDVYSDPCFGLRIVKPLVSSSELKNRMKDRRAVTVSKVKEFIKTENLENDWVIAGVLIQQSPTKVSQNGKQYSIWSISDLSEEINSVSIFLFSNAYKLFWKTQTGTVVGILNPSVMESRGKNDQVTLSIDNPQKIMILGNSMDMGTCISVKKSGDKCTNIVNKNKCEYCIYHVKQEYNKASRRSDLQTDKNNRRFGNAFGNGEPKNYGSGLYSQQKHHQNILSIPAKKNKAMEQKDSERLAMLMGEPTAKKIIEKEKKNECSSSSSSSSIESVSQIKKYPDRLDKIRGCKLTDTTTVKVNSSVIKKQLNNEKNISGPCLGAGVTGDLIDFSIPITKKHINSAKLNAIKWAEKKGGIKQSNPNKIRESRDKIEAAAKRRREEEEEEGENKNLHLAKKTNTTSDKFKELLNVKSVHTDLIEKSHDDEKEKYFNKLEAKERMEEKMMTTFKVDTKAVKCLVCKYTSFSASEFCKEKKHPLKVIDAVKSFFKCSNCGFRTVSLDRLPSENCKKCFASSWQRAAMMDEKRVKLPGATLSIRGGEEQFIGTTTHDAHINLLVPDNEK